MMPDYQGMPDPSSHDPGPIVAGERAAVAGDEPGRVIRAGGLIRIGTASWADRTMTAKGVFYPSYAKTPEDRLRFYASRFPVVEADASYYALLSPAMTQLWAERTPDDFVLDVKAYAALTGHPAETSRLPKALREAVLSALPGKARFYLHDLPVELRDEVWRQFRDALRPLWEANKLGAVLFQYPSWFMPGSKSRDAIVEASERLRPVGISVEFRNRRWFTPDTTDRTIAFLEDHKLPLVSVDEPQGLESSVPPVAIATSHSLAVVRMHGRRGDTWGKSGVSTTEKYRYLYDAEELTDWVPRVLQLARTADEVHMLFNNCYRNYATTNAREFMSMLAATA
jgi:uncharacterized protein YecE (DUF72 family)